MSLSIKNAINNQKVWFPFEISLIIVYNDNRVELNEPISLIGEYMLDGNQASVKGELKTKLRCTCDLCLESFDYTLKLDFFERFAQNSDDLEVYQLSGFEINIEEPVLHNILLNLPSKLLCKDDCKGLCPTCFTNNNEQSCSCGL